MHNARFAFYIQLLAICMGVLSVRLWCVYSYGSVVPYWDQWDSEATLMFIPWLNGTAGLEILLQPHSEHHIYLSRLLSLALLELNELHWDPRLQMAVNALLATLIAAVTGSALKSHISRPFLLMLITLLWLPPIAAENIIAAFQSMWYLMILMTLLAFIGLLLNPLFSRYWWAGLLAAALAFFNLSTGFAAATIIAFISLLLVIIDPDQRKKHLVNLGCGTLITAGCLWILLSKTPSLHSSSHDIVELLMQFTHVLAWPLGKADSQQFIFNLLAATLVHVPWIALAFQALKQRRNPGPVALLAIALGLWSCLQAAGIAHSRPGPIALRYNDLLLLGLLGSFLAVYEWQRRFTLSHHGIVQILTGLTLLWAGTITIQLASLTENSLKYMQLSHTYSQIQKNNVQQFLSTGNAAVLQGKPMMHIPYPSSERLIKLLSNPTLQRILPPSLTSNHMMPISAQTPDLFVPNGYFPTTGGYRGELVIGSYGAQGNAAFGQLVSQPLTIESSYISIAVAGYLDGQDLRLELNKADGSSRLLNLVPDKPPAESWQTFHIPAPREPFRLIATDMSKDLWFAFSMPKGIGWLTAWSEFTLKRWYLLFYAACALLMASALLPQTHQRK